MSIQSYIFGGENTAIKTPEDLARKRELVDAMMSQQISSQTPRNLGEGLGAIGKALMVRKARGDLESGMADVQSGQDTINPLIRDAMMGGQAPADPIASQFQIVQTPDGQGQEVNPNLPPALTTGQPIPAPKSAATGQLEALIGIVNRPEFAFTQQQNPAKAKMVLDLIGELQAKQDPAYQLKQKMAQIEYDRLLNPLPKEEAKPAAIQEYEYAKNQGFAGSFQDYEVAMKKAGAQNINMGGGSDKQIFDTMAESSKSAQTAATGLNALREARKALPNAITGAGADTRLALQKIGALIGVASPESIVDTETFRASIAPQVAAMLRSTVGTTNISNTDREFAEKATGGTITLDSGSISRLLGIMETAGTAVLNAHKKRLDSVYPDTPEFARERALFGTQYEAPPPNLTGKSSSGVGWSVQ